MPSSTDRAFDRTLLTPTVAEINLAHLRHNLHVLQEHAGAADVMGVVKANAYGHGAVRVAEALRQEGVRAFAVATVPEAVRLRIAGLTDTLLVFAAPLPAYLPAYARHDLDVTVSSADVAEAVSAAAKRWGPLRVHVKIDTGMGRLGVPPGDAARVIRMLERARGVTVAGIWTHFASADEGDDAFTRAQLDRFSEALAPVETGAARLHTANSAALLRLPEHLHSLARPWVRTGIALYGLANVPALAQGAGLRPVMRLTSRVTHLKVVEPGTPISYGRRWHAARRSRIATIGAGYADGYPRLLSNRGTVGLHGKRYPVAGTVCMDMFMVDLGDPDGPGAEMAVGDEVVLFGPGGPSAIEVASWAQTIPYEICCGIAGRVPRYYRDASLPARGPDRAPYNI
jgi:alanine racemase